MKKIIQKLFLFFFLIVILTFLLFQTSFGKEKIRKWIEKKMEGSLVIGKIEGIFPFWLHMHDVQYQNETIKLNSTTIELLFSPISLLFGKISVLKLYVDQMNLDTSKNIAPTSLNQPCILLPITFQSIEIPSLNLNEFKNISLKGRGEISKNIALYFTAHYQGGFFQFRIERKSQEKMIEIDGRFKKNREINIYLSGAYEANKKILTGKISGNMYAWQVKTYLCLSESDLNLTNTIIEKDDLLISGSLSFNLNTHFFEGDGFFLEQAYSTKGVMNWNRGEVSLSDFFLEYFGNTLHSDLAYSSNTNTLTGALALDLKNSFQDSIQGVVSGNLSIKPEEKLFTILGRDITWKDLTFSEMHLDAKVREEQLSFSLHLKDFIMLDPAYEVFPTTHLNLNGEATKKQLTLQGEVLGLGSEPFTLLADLPIHFSLIPFDITINPNHPFSISLKGKGSIDPILAFLENGSLMAHGDIDMNLALHGHWNEPQIKGTLLYENGRIESLATGAIFENIRMEAVGENHLLKIQSMTASDSEQGKLVGSGQIEWNPEKNFPFKWIIQLDKFHLLTVDLLTMSANADLSLSGNVKEMSIQGTANIVEGELTIPNKMPLHIPTLEVTYINLLPTAKPEIETSPPIIPISLDLQIQIPKRFYINGRGLNSEWSGHIHIHGLQDALEYLGEIKLLQGRFSLIGKTFDLVEGKILIHGLDPKNILVDLKGDLDLSTITASINVSGNLDATHLVFTSNPPMDTNQILSQILFNQGINELTPFQACRLASILVQLSGKYAGPTIWNNIKAGLGIDVFDITNCDLNSADLTFQFGKYISQGTFVGVSKSLSGDFDSVLIQTRLYHDFYLQANYGGSLNSLTPSGGKIIFKWYKSY
ncbi:MAG: translocation/assembly module TamB domain-containing protein [Chlamydiales bacterium]